MDNPLSGTARQRGFSTPAHPSVVTIQTLLGDLELQLINFWITTKDKVSTISELGPGGAWQRDTLHIKLSVLAPIREREREETPV